MAVRIPLFVREPVVLHDLAADKRLEWEGRKHVEAKASAADQYGLGCLAYSSTYTRATLTMILSAGKLFSTLPSVLSPKVKKPPRAMTRQATIEIPVE